MYEEEENLDEEIKSFFTRSTQKKAYINGIPIQISIKRTNLRFIWGLSFCAGETRSLWRDRRNLAS